MSIRRKSYNDIEEQEERISDTARQLMRRAVENKDFAAADRIAARLDKASKTATKYRDRISRTPSFKQAYREAVELNRQGKNTADAASKMFNTKYRSTIYHGLPPLDDLIPAYSNALSNVNG